MTFKNTFEIKLYAYTCFVVSFIFTYVSMKLCDRSDLKHDFQCIYIFKASVPG